MRALAVGLVLSSCLQPVSSVSVTVSGDCAGQLEAFVDGKAQDVSTPVGEGTRVEVRCTVNGSVVSWGSAFAPIAVPLWPVGSFVPISGRPVAARAGHTATTLQDGAVFIAAGYTSGPSGPSELSSTERFELAGETFSGGPSLGVAGGTGGVYLPRAFHTATLMLNGQVVMHGGEIYRDGGTISVGTTVVYDPPSGKYGIARPEISGTIPRSRHAAFLTDAGDVLLVGGVSKGDPVPEVQRLDVETFVMHAVDGADLSQGVAAAVWSPAKNAVAAVDGAGDTTYVDADGARGSDAVNAKAPVVQVLSHGSALLVVSDGVSGVLDVTTHVSTPGPAVRVVAGSCAVALGPDAWVVIGGDAAQGISWTSAGVEVRAFSAPPTSRVEHTCTQLADGTVLVLGGRASDGTTLGDAYRFVPPAEWR